MSASSRARRPGAGARQRITPGSPSSWRAPLRISSPARRSRSMAAIRCRAEMTQTPLTGIKACVFDAYGTLFDFASAAKSCAELLADQADRLTALWRDKQLQYSWLRAVQGRHAEFWQVTGDGLDYALDTLGIYRPGLRDRLMALYLSLETFPEVTATLRRPNEVGCRPPLPAEW